MNLDRVCFLYAVNVPYTAVPGTVKASVVRVTDTRWVTHIKRIADIGMVLMLEVILMLFSFFSVS